jgi:hypothetical protein
VGLPLRRRTPRRAADRAVLALPSDTLVQIASTRFSVFGRSFTARDLRIHRQRRRRRRTGTRSAWTRSGSRH